MTDRRGPKCSKCGKSARQIGRWLSRVNATGQPGVWECRPNCEADVLYECHARLLECETRIKHLEWLLRLAIEHVRKHKKIAHALDDLFEARDLAALCELSELQYKIDEALGHD